MKRSHRADPYQMLYYHVLLLLPPTPPHSSQTRRLKTSFFFVEKQDFPAVHWNVMNLSFHSNPLLVLKASFPFGIHQRAVSYPSNIVSIWVLWYRELVYDTHHVLHTTRQLQHTPPAANVIHVWNIIIYSLLGEYSMWERYEFQEHYGFSKNPHNDDNWETNKETKEWEWAVCQQVLSWTTEDYNKSSAQTDILYNQIDLWWLNKLYTKKVHGQVTFLPKRLAPTETTDIFKFDLSTEESAQKL